MFRYRNRETGFMCTVRVFNRWSSTSSRRPACWVVAKIHNNQTP